MRKVLKAIGRLWRVIDPASLQFRLTVGVAVVSIVGISGVAIWTTWKTQQILVASQKESAQDIAERFPRDVELYSDMMSMPDAVRRAIDNRTLPGLLIVVSDANDAVLARSDHGWQQDEAIVDRLLNLPDMLIEPQVYRIGKQYFIACSGPLMIGDQAVGQFYLAQDITSDHLRFVAVIHSLGIATVLAILVTTIVIAWYVRRSLQPLRQFSQLTETISVQDLGNATLQLEGAPTEVSELARTCENMLARLSDSWEQQRQFANNISHELRTPLTIVSGYLQSTLRRCTTLSEPQREALEIASAEASRTIQLLQDLLDLARADSGHMHFILEPIHLKDLALEVTGMAERCSNAVVNVEAQPPDICVKADRNRLKQVLLNLVDNALQSSSADQPVMVHLSQQGEMAKIQVRDRGCGIALYHQARIFDRFYRVDEARSRSTGGCGLGLSIVKTLVEGMGGTVTVRSNLTEGSVFTVTLPSSPSES